MIGALSHGTDRQWKRWANIGGPMSRTRSVRVVSSLLGEHDGAIRCPCVIRLGLLFPEGVDPVEHMLQLLHRSGHRHPEDLRACFDPPSHPYACRLAPQGSPRLEVAKTPVAEVLHQALLLGLCTAHRYDPLRAVLWTQASLTRCVELFDTEGFYA